MVVSESLLMISMMAAAVYVAYAKIAPGPVDPFAGLLPEHLEDPDEAVSLS